MNKFRIFREISFGGITKDQLLQRLADAGIQFNKYANVLFLHQSFSPSIQTRSVKLVKVTLSDLNLKNPCSFQEILDRALSMNLNPCPLYLAAFLRLEYMDQPDGLYLTIASLPPSLDDETGHDESFPTGFYIRNFEQTFWLRGYKVDGAPEWPANNEFIFQYES